jgi:bisphosphoglycerate-independent phosphoglycerate mutase (AlkP superfamily)
MTLQVRVNLPNGDIVGHTGDIEATIVGCGAVDETVKVGAKLLLFLLPYVIVIV